MSFVVWFAVALIAAFALYELLIRVSVYGILRSYRRTPIRVKREFGFAEPSDLGLEGEELEVEVEPGLILRGFVFRTDQPRRGLLVYHHGIWDACRPRLQTAVRMLPLGFDCLFYDARGHGQSGGRYCTYGAKERHDLVKMLDATQKLGVDTSHTVVIGHSMGAATAVYTALMDDRIKALVLEACYRDLPTAIRDYARVYVIGPPDAVLRSAQKRAARKGDFNLEELSPLKLMPRLKIPVLFVQGSADRRIKPRYVQEHYDAKPPPRDLHYIEGARHGRVWHEGGEAYLVKLEEWLGTHMPVLEPQSHNA